MVPQFLDLLLSHSVSSQVETIVRLSQLRLSRTSLDTFVGLTSLPQDLNTEDFGLNMASVKSMFYLGLCVSAWIITTAGQDNVAKNVRWMSLDFKTTLTWTAPANHTFSVLYSVNDGNWMEVGDCLQISDNHCDLTHNLEGNDGTYTADIQTDETDSDYTWEEPPHTFSPPFNPYRESNISAPHFSVEIVDESTVTLNITDPLTGIHWSERQLNIRDIFKHDLKYKISYYKSGSTGKRDITADSSVAEISNLDAGQIYCFMVAAYIPKRPKITQQGPWSEHECIKGGDVVQELSLGAWVGGVFVCLTVLVIIVTVTVLCCRCCRQRNKSLHASQSSVPV